MAQSGPTPSQGTEEAQKAPFLPQMALPKGGGAVRGIGEKVSVNPARGTGSMQLPIFTSPGRSGFGPSLSLDYDSGDGNSVFGMGWGVAIPSIGRKTDKGLPRYADADTFVFTGAEDLVPSEESIPDETIDGVIYQVSRFRPRVQSAFTRIERLRSDDGDIFWRTVTRDNVRSVFGRAARIADPSDPSRVFQWLLEEVRDDRGNVATYEYVSEPVPIDDAVWERNRRGLPQPQRYLSRIRYCEHFVLEFEYEPRPDPFSTCRSGFEVRTWQRCRRIAMYHDFPAEFQDGPNPRLIRSTDLSYDDDPAGCHLVAATQTGYLWSGTDYTTESLPPVQFEYTRSEVDDVVRVVEAENLPSGVDNQRYHWVDLDGEGIPGALTQQGGSWFYKRNLGGGRLGALESVAMHPSLAADGESLALLDLAGDGGRSLVRHGPAMHGYQERAGDGWGPFQPFAHNATAVWGDPALQQVDLSGDGLTDLLLLHGEELLHHKSLGRNGFGPQLRTLLGEDEERGPVLLAADASESIMLADMSGDGLADLVRVRNGSVCYWPNLGHGQFGAKVTMAGAPLFDSPELFEPSRLRTADIDGSGTTDLLYLGRDRVRFWLNQSGNRFAEPVSLKAFPDTDDLSTVDVVDLLGSGTACLVWSSSNVSDRESPLRYVDLSRAVSEWLPATEAAGHKPHMLCQVTNNLGAQTRVVYAPSTRYYLADRAAGTPWATKLHFPVQVVARTEAFDHIAKTRLTSAYRFRDGYFDAPEREYRGFGMVEQTDAETFPLFDEVSSTELHRPPVRTRSWFHLGTEMHSDMHTAESVLGPGLSAVERREALRALAGQPLRTEVYADDGVSDAPYTVTEHRYQVRRVQDRVFRHHPLETVSYYYERDLSDPRVKHDIVLEVDEYNTVRRAVSIGYPRQNPEIPEQGQLAMVRTVSEFAHVTSGAAYRLAMPVETRTYEVTGLAPAGDLFTLAEADQPGTARLIEHIRTRYWNDTLTAPLAPGQVGARALPHQTFQLALTAQVVSDIYGGKVTPDMLTEGGYTLEDGDWWIPSGIMHYDPASFYLPAKQVSPFGNVSTVEYDAYKLLPVVTHQSLTAPFDVLVSSAVNDYRLLVAAEVTDPNGSRSRSVSDALGRVTATWAQGKEGEGDPDGLPGAEFSYHTASLPIWAHARQRERHGDAGSPWQASKAYSDGMGRVVMTKQQATPDENGPRWIGSGRTVFDNKGKPVKQYEPYFSGADGYEDEPDIVQQGVTPILHYDAIGRLIRTENPDGTLSRVVIGAWSTQSWDAVDTVKDSLWYAERGSPDPSVEPEPSDPQRRAAWLAAQHAATPPVSHVDSLGREVRSIADAGPLGLLEIVTELDIEGQVRSMTDPRGIAVQNSSYDLAGRAVYVHSPDAGDRVTLPDIAGVPIWTWDGINVFHQEFDLLRRPLRTSVGPENAPSLMRVVTATWYGEAHPSGSARNLYGRMAITVDEAGLVVVVEHDFKGNLRTGRRRLLADAATVVDWGGLEAVPVSDVESTVSPVLEPEVHQTATDFDALNRAVTAVAPDGSVTALSYNEAGRLDTVKVDQEFHVREMEYDAKGQRQFIVYGNFVRTKYTYDKLSYRLTRLETFRSNAPNQPLQDLGYTYDPAGNIVEIRDNAQQIHFYAGLVTQPVTRYTYDAVYRLASATGREHESIQPGHSEPVFGKPIPHANDASKLRPYTQTYSYDKSGNLTRMQHSSGPNGSWTRDYLYAVDSNRLLDANGSFGYDVHGNMTGMPHLPGPLTWDHANRLATVQMLGGGTGRYTYDNTGQRIRKTLSRNGGLVEERVYLGPFEIHTRTLNGNGTFRRTTLHVMDDATRIALIERDTIADETRVRYQFGNHLGSCSLEVDNSSAAKVISYEEYHPFGTTSAWLGDGGIEASDRRYRYTGKEKDEETALYYHGARYYAPWLGRWTAPDPAGLADGTNRYVYVRGNPVRLVDPSGRDSAEQEAARRAQNRLPGSLSPDEIGDVYANIENVPKDLIPYDTPEFHERAQNKIDRGNAKRAAAKAEAKKNPPLTKEEKWQVAKDSARNWAIDKASVSPTTAMIFPLLTPNMLLGEFVLKPLRAPEPSEFPSNFREWQARENYDHMQYTLTAVELSATFAVGPILESAAVLKPLQAVEAAAVGEASAAAKANPFAFMDDLGVMGQRLQGQVDEAATALRPFQGWPVNQGGVPYQLQVGGATTIVDGKQVTSLTFSHPNAYQIFSGGYATLPEGTALGKAPALIGRKLPLSQHVERAAVESVDPGRQLGGLVTTSGGACEACSAAWSQGDFATWLHLKWQQF